MITLSDAQWVTAAVTCTEAKYLVTLMSPQTMHEAPSPIARANHLKLEVDDIELPVAGYACPREEHIEQLLEFGYQLDEDADIVIHCVMGLSRSPAAMMILLAQKNPKRAEDVVGWICRKVPSVRPNRLMLAIGDRLLGCGGALLSSAWAGLPPAPMDKPTYRGSLDGFESFPLYLDVAN